MINIFREVMSCFSKNLFMRIFFIGFSMYTISMIIDFGIEWSRYVVEVRDENLRLDREKSYLEYVNEHVGLCGREGGQGGYYCSKLRKLYRHVQSNIGQVNYIVTDSEIFELHAMTAEVNRLMRDNRADFLNKRVFSEKILSYFSSWKAVFWVVLAFIGFGLYVYAEFRKILENVAYK